MGKKGRMEGKGGGEGGGGTLGEPKYWVMNERRESPFV